MRRFNFGNANGKGLTFWISSLFLEALVWGSGLGAVQAQNSPPEPTVILHAFGTEDGFTPSGGVIEGSDGAFYGTTSDGGSSRRGIVYRINPDGSSYTILHSFSRQGWHNGQYGNTDGALPTGLLLQGSDGYLYGTTQNGGTYDGGVIYRISPDGLYLQVIHHFTGGRDGATPVAGVIQGNDGALYGTASHGGAYGNGVVFKVNPDGSNFQVLHNFSGNDGSSPYARVIQGSDGALYGTTLFGGVNGNGVVFKVNPDGSFQVLHNFTGGNDGAHPFAGVIQGSDGALYGTARDSANGQGVVFKVNPNGSNFQVLHNFSGNDGGGPYAGVIQGSDGALYGTTIRATGSVYWNGVVFKVNPDGSNFQVIYKFYDPYDGATPNAPLTLGRDGLLYSTTIGGGIEASTGVIYRLKPDGTGFQVLYRFLSRDGLEGIDGESHITALIQGSDGMLYGTTAGGGAAGVGVVFRVNPDGSNFQLIHSFSRYSGFTNYTNDDGAHPLAGVIQGSDGALYGTTSYGGPLIYHPQPGGGYNTSRDNGVLFKVNRDGTGFQVLHVFGSSDDGHGHLVDGTHPQAGVIQGADGYLYGTTSYGGYGGTGIPYVLGDGVVYKVKPDGSNFQVLHLFDTMTDQYGNPLDGSNPVGGLIQGRDGALYGTTIAGGTNGTGVIFKLNSDGTGFRVLHTFSATSGPWYNPYINDDGAYPSASLLQGKDGALYGTTSHGGAYGGGVIFKINPDGTGFTVLHAFTQGGDGNSPQIGLIQGSIGALYGTTIEGGGGWGVVFKINPDGSNFHVLHNFGEGYYGADYDAQSVKALIQGRDGNLYGLSSYGGDAGSLGDTHGTLFRIGPQLLSVAPASVAAGSGDLQLTLVGTGFAQNDTLLWNGTTS
ncbi:MAG TPA: choice-of-anchor tandem repeat GloVer-containing protein, partial [Chthonomonas sp.]|uniref:choice-of-anchor tandem repeat GloVer-containing protein n=1 Tax=Chthonomonas sp. TaxID=2282153 RepID=UPI002B4AF6C4